MKLRARSVAIGSAFWRRPGAAHALLVAGAALIAVAAAQEPERRMACDESRGSNGRARVCEIRELTVPAGGALRVDAGPNGGVTVIGSDRSDVLVRAKVQAWGETEQDASETAAQVEILTDGEVRAEGPEGGRRSGWAVSYEILAPRETDLRLEATNGGIAIEDVSGNLEFETLNGGIRLDGVAGTVHGSTTNGGVDVTLTGATWQGESLDVETTNGGITLRVPENYSARLETGTVNGGLDIGFPVTVQGRIGRRELSTTLGEGGPLVRATTVNGGVRVARY